MSEKGFLSANRKETVALGNDRIAVGVKWGLLTLLTLLPCFFLTAPFVEDSLGTMATAAYLTGHDWSVFLAEDGYFYKYGTSIWYLLPFEVTDNPILRYRFMLVVNGLLHLCMVWLCYRLLRRLGQGNNALPIALLVGLLPSALLYSKLTWAEPVLFLIPWVVLHLLLSLNRGDLSPLRRKLFSALLALTSVYAYMSHQRGIVIVAATTLTVFIVNWKRKGRPKPVHFPFYTASLILALMADHFLTKWEKATVFGGVELQHNTLSQILHSGLGRMLSPKGLAMLGKAVIGWLFHSGAATFGLAYVGLLAMVIALLSAQRKREAMQDRDVVSAFGVLCYFGAFALGLLFFFHYLYDYWAGVAVERCDRLIFGRYLESSLPLLLTAGILTLEKNGDDKPGKWVLLAAGGLLVFCTAFFALFIAPTMQGADCYVHSLMALNLFMDTSNVTVTKDLITNLPQAVSWFGLLSIGVFAAVYILRRKGKRLAYGLIAVLFLLIYIRSMATILCRIDAAGLTVFAQYYLSH